MIELVVIIVAQRSATEGMRMLITVGREAEAACLAEELRLPVAREEFPSLSRMTYLNTTAEGIRYWEDKLQGMAGHDSHFAALADAKQQVARAFCLPATEVAIRSCTSEAYNLLIYMTLSC